MRVLEHEPIARHGYWRVGGPADRLVVVDTPAELAEVWTPGALVLGNGSNLLVPDAGLRGTVVKLGAGFRDTEIVAQGGDDVLLRVGAGLPNAVLLARLQKLGLGGAGCLAGVPGTIGGAVAMNAGTALGEIADVLVAVEGLTGRIARGDLPMRYREGGLPPGFVVTAAVLRLSRSGVDEEQARIATHLARRKATQPLDLPSCGSVFRNPPGDYAGRLIESVGLKGFRAGNAQISPMHANFIVNVGNATADDVMTCIHTAWSAVRARTGIALVPEVHVVGEWPSSVWPLSASSSML